MNRFILYFILIFLNLHTHTQAYTPSPYVSTELWEELKPYFLPENHPVKPALDAIFTSSRAICSSKTLKIAGFKFADPNTPRSATAAKHSKLKGYLVKLYTDDQPFSGEWEDWKKRIVGARYIQEAINRHGYQSLFKVPQKWIYPLPDKPAPPAGHHRKYFVLIVEDMKILKNDDNLLFWRSVAMTFEKLDALHTILHEEGLIDSVYPDNVPFCKDGKLAFVDTQHYRQWPIKFYRLTPYLFKEMQMYWEQIIE